MFVRKVVGAFLIACAVTACGGSEASAPPPEMAQTEPPPPAEPAEPVAQTEPPPPAEPAEPPPPPAPIDVTVTVTSSVRGRSGPPRGPAALTAETALNAIRLQATNFSHHCSPAPSFTGRVEGDTLRVQLAAPTAAVSRCVAPYTLGLNVDVPGRNGVMRIVLVGTDGAEIASATPTGGGATASAAPAN